MSSGKRKKRRKGNKKRTEETSGGHGKWEVVSSSTFVFWREALERRSGNTLCW
ncbi:unnamed protein product [Brassica rapa]|uniref:Uncharacterized protein n=1 Tax=Brassica campestris TaxID=3711 RepID=A0A8D9HKL1_BRACM|nr:unnamed protein product [Brassica rapa]